MEKKRRKKVPMHAEIEPATSYSAVHVTTIKQLATASGCNCKYHFHDLADCTRCTHFANKQRAGLLHDLAMETKEF